MMNNISIALISGKGGSGKTTLSLGMASLLSECGIKVLLVDCDLSTNGATYFYEKRLNNERISYTSFSDSLMSDQSVENHNLMSIDQYYFFMPSTTRIPDEDSLPFTHSELEESHFIDYYNKLKETYEAIIFDCQAGYTDILTFLLPLVDKALVVMEADAVSSAAVRSLYLKIGNLIKNKVSYQVFNKTTKEENDIYSKVSDGTLFTNLGCINFDWKVRKAFSILATPNINNTSVEYGQQLYELSNIMFDNNSMLERLEQYSLQLDIRQTKDKEEELTGQLVKIQEKNSHKDERSFSERMVRYLTSLDSSILLGLVGVVIAVLSLSVLSIYEKPNTFTQLVLIVFVLASTILSFSTTLRELKRKKADRTELTAKKEYVLTQQLSELAEQRKKLEAKYAKIQDDFGLNDGDAEKDT